MEAQSPKRSILKINPMKKKQRFHFSLENDIQLLTLVIKYNPWLYGVQQWEEVSKEMLSDSLILSGRGSVTARSARDRTGHILQLFKLQDLRSIDKGSTPELYHERALLLAQVAHLKENSEAMAEINIENPRTVNIELEDCVEYDPINVSECSNTSVNSTNITELKTYKTKSKKNEEDLDEEGEEEEQQQQQKSYSKDSSDYAKRKYLAITKRIDMEMNLKVKEFALKQKQTEEDMKLKRLKTEADIARQQKELELEDRRLKLEEMKAIQQNKMQQEMLEQQKLMLSVMAKLTDNKKK